MLESVRNGLAVRDVLILDAHAHLGACAPDFTIYDHSPEKLLDTMDRLGVDRLCVSSLTAIWGDPEMGNEETAQAVARHPERLSGYLVFNPRFGEGALDALDRSRSIGVMGMVKIHPFVHRYPATGPQYLPLWDYCNQHELIVLSHTDGGDPTCSPLLFDRIAGEFPRVKILLGHMGITHDGLEEALEAARRRDSLYLEIASSFSPFGSIERAVSGVGADRVLFGSDVPFFAQEVSLGRVAYARISDAEKERIFGLNMRDLMASSGLRLFADP